MKTPEQQVKELLEQTEELNKRTLTVPLTERQVTIFRKLLLERAETEQKLTKLKQQEQDFVDFAVDFQKIDPMTIEYCAIEQNNLLIVKKPIEKKMQIVEEPVPNVEEVKKEITEVRGHADIPVLREENHK